MNKLLIAVARNALPALAARMGTAIAAFLLAQDIPHDTIQQFTVALGVVGGLLFDILVSIFLKRERAATDEQR